MASGIFPGGIIGDIVGQASPARGGVSLAEFARQQALRVNQATLGLDPSDYRRSVEIRPIEEPKKPKTYREELQAETDEWLR